MQLHCTLEKELKVPRKKNIILVLNLGLFDIYNEKKKSYNFLSDNFRIKSFFKRWSEQLVIFSFIYLFYIPNTNFSIVLSSNYIKWIYPFFFLHQKKKSRKNNVAILLKNLFNEELNILINETEIEIYKEKKKSNLLNAFRSIFYLCNILIKKNFNADFQILTLNFIFLPQINIIKWKEIVELSKRFNIVLDFYNLCKENIEAFHYGAYKTKGIYCKPFRETNELIFGKSFANCLLALFILPLFNRQFFLLPIPTKSIININLNRLKTKKYYVCSICLSVSALCFSNCFVCGKKVLNIN
nr:transcription initiation factor TFIIH subunit H3 isoform 2 [Cryptomonas curvata]